MTLLVLLASILIVVVTVYQYDEQTKDYNIHRFERKEATTIETINLELTNKTTYPVKTENLKRIFYFVCNLFCHFSPGLLTFTSS